jgi:hypothetical protein
MAETTTHGTPCMLFYDIPSNSGIPNPSRHLRSRGVRVNLSCWVLPESRVPYALLNELSQEGATWHVVRFDPAEAHKLARMAFESLRKEAENAVRRAMRSEENAQAHAEERGPEAYRLWVERSVRRAEAILNDLTTGAQALGLTFDIQTGLVALSGIQSAAQARAAVYAGMVEEAKRRGLAQAAELAGRNEIPGQVLADMLEEDGADVTHAHEAFADVSM